MGGLRPPLLVEQKDLMQQVERPMAPFRGSEAPILHRCLDAIAGFSRAGQKAFAQIAGKRGRLFGRQ